MTRPPAIAHSFHAVVALLESVNGQIGAISTDARTNAQQLATISENQARTHDEFAELRAMIRQQHEVNVATLIGQWVA
jgi:hypothetical protein